MNQIYQIQKSDLTNGVIAELSARELKLERRIDEVKTSIDEVKTSLEAKINEVKTSLEAKIETGIAQMEIRISQTEKELIKWMFLFWTGSVITILGSLFVFLKLFLRP
jgi:hypothetical protein